MMNIRDAGVHLGVDPDVAAESSTGQKRRTRPMNDKICTRECVVLIEVVKILEERTYHPVRGSSGCPPHALLVAGAVEGANTIRDRRKI
jgi:hypothetical protein